MINELKRYAGDELVSLSSITKPTNLEDGARLYEVDTRNIYIKSGNAWVPMGSGSNMTVVNQNTGIVYQFRVKEVGGDWLRCKSLNGSTEEGSDTYVAKSHELRRSPWDGQTISVPVEGWQNNELVTGAVNLTYTYRSNNLRTVDNGLAQELEAVFPAWQTGITVIYAGYADKDTTVLDPDDNVIRYVDLNNAARIWASMPNLSGLVGTGSQGDSYSATILDDMALDQAVYHTGLDKIFGVSNQWLFRFNSSGLMENSLRFSKTREDSYITYVGNSGYISTWHDILRDDNKDPFDATAVCPESDIHRIDLVNFATGGKMRMGDIFGLPNSSNFGLGPRNILGVTGMLYGVVNKAQVYFVNPTGIGSYFAGWSTSAGASSKFGFDYDVTSGIVLFCCELDECVSAVDRRYGAPNFNEAASTTPDRPFCGLTMNQATRFTYAVAGNCIVSKIGTTGIGGTGIWANTDLSHSLINLALQDNSLTGIKPANIRWNQYDGLIYVPTWTDDRVVIFNPTGDTIVAIKSGFSSPFDMVFTPTKKFAVQQSRTGLKEVV